MGKKRAIVIILFNIILLTKCKNFFIIIVKLFIFVQISLSNTEKFKEVDCKVRLISYYAQREKNNNFLVAIFVFGVSLRT